MGNAYYFDQSLSPEESMCQFGLNGRETSQERYYTVAIRRIACPGWVFRFPSSDRTAQSILEILNRSASKQGAA